MISTKSAQLQLCSLAALGLSIGLCAMAAPTVAQSVTIENESAARADPSLLFEPIAALIQKGLYPQALDLLDQAEAFGADPQQILFLRAEVAKNTGDTDSAITYYRQILDKEPDALRVRLELGLLYFLLEDDTKAELQLRYALAGQLPEAAVEKVDAILDQIRRRRDWGFYVEFALAPDSNINAAPNDSEIDVFDLPFRLDDDAQESSGIGAETALGGYYNIELTPDLEWQQSARIDALLYEETDFNDLNVNLRTGLLKRGGMAPRDIAKPSVAY